MNLRPHSLSATRRNNIKHITLILQITFISGANFIFALDVIVKWHLASKLSVLTQAS